MTWVKVCGITNLADALAAANAGADAIGFVFADSPRQVSVQTAARISPALPKDLERVGVFVNAPLELVRGVAQVCGLTMVQLHGREDPEYCAAIGRDVFSVIKAVRLAGEDSLSGLADYKDSVHAFLLDAYVVGMAGGTGQTIDYALAARARETLGKKVIVAGGLGPDNVAEAVRKVRPFGVDASSRLEAGPGRKDHGLVRRYIEEARRV